MEVSVNLVPRSYRLTLTEMYNHLAVDGLGTRLGISMTILDFIPIDGKLQKFTADKGSSLKDTHRLQGCSLSVIICVRFSEVSKTGRLT